MTTKKFIARDLFFLTLFLALLFGAFLGTRPLMVPDEGRYVEIPREMVESGDYLTPHLNYMKYFEKPALFYWMIAASIKLFGLNEWTLRAVVSIMSLLGCLMVYIAGLRLYDRRTGILSCLILATSALYFSMTRFIITDMPVTLWITASLLLFILGTQEPATSKKRYYFWGMYACAALAVMTKGLIGIVIPGMIIFSWLCVTREWRQLRTYCLPTGILLFLLIAAPWHILVQLKNPEFFRFYFIDQHFLRYLTDYAGRQQAVWFFPAVTLGGLFPWACFLLAFLATPVKKQKIIAWVKNIFNHRENQITAFFVLWTVVLFVFFSLSKSQLLSYALPLMPPLGILIARYFSLHWAEASNRTIRIGFLLVGILGFIAGVGGVIALQMNAIHSVLAYVGIAVLFVGTLSSSILYRCCGIQAGIITLILTAGASFIAGDVAYPEIDTRSLKSLVAILKPQLKPDTEVAVYHEYYQDLPPYLERRITVVAYKGELEFGMQHQDTSAWMLHEETFWQRWHNQPGMFMIASKDDYATFLQQKVAPLYLIDQSTQDVLLTNSR
jgi:4-amino-4-deoxy-L-arabinose transferase-like glycosyltransferase